MSGWMPIESAPKDKEILVFCIPSKHVAFAWWKPEEESKYSIYKAHWVIVPRVFHMWGDKEVEDSPSHWMPFPPPPQEE